MANISILKQHDKPEAEIESLVEDLQHELSSRYGCICKREGDNIAIRRSGISGQLRLMQNQVAVDIKLGPMMGVFANRLEPVIRRKLDEHLD
ncbi:MAG: hypothetical protein HKO71_03495 [Pseudomonadales bacterium]|nr:hypothetical protein [Pseudomonadales bacterium]